MFDTTLSRYMRPTLNYFRRAVDQLTVGAQYPTAGVLAFIHTQRMEGSMFPFFCRRVSAWIKSSANSMTISSISLPPWLRR